MTFVTLEVTIVICFFSTVLNGRLLNVHRDVYDKKIFKKKNLSRHRYMFYLLGGTRSFKRTTIAIFRSIFDIYF